MRALALIACCVLLACASAPSRTSDAPSDKCNEPGHRQFDFWVGDWDVQREDGSAAGHNRIESILGGCVIRETYVAAKPPYAGTSLNIYDAGRGTWHQTWVDNGGLLLTLDGRLEGDRMVLRGTTKSPDGELLHEIAWTPLDDGRVRQHWRVSEDGGESWKDVFVGLYSKSE